jgi:hypothetical protein
MLPFFSRINNEYVNQKGSNQWQTLHATLHISPRRDLKLL